MALRTRCIAAAFGACLLLAGCAASLPRAPVVVTAGERTRLQLVDPNDAAKTFTLQNVSSGARADVYRDGAGDLNVKVVDDAQLQELLDVLAAGGMFAQTGAAVAPGARSAIAVEQGGRRSVWSRPPALPANIEAIRSYDECRAYVLTVFNAATAYQTRQVRDLDPSLRAKIEAQQQKSGAARSKATGSKQ